MANVAKYDDQTLYNTWVAFGRNASQAAKSLGMDAPAMQWHVRTKNFQHKYLLEYGGLAEGTMRAGIVSAMLAIPEMVDQLLDIARTNHMALDPETGITGPDAKVMMAKVKAIDTLTKFFPQVPQTAKELQELGVTTIEANPQIVENLSPEEEIRAALEANIIDAAEQRSGAKR